MWDLWIGGWGISDDSGIVLTLDTQDGSLTGMSSPQTEYMKLIKPAGSNGRNYYERPVKDGKVLDALRKSDKKHVTFRYHQAKSYLFAFLEKKGSRPDGGDYAYRAEVLNRDLRFSERTSYDNYFMHLRVDLVKNTIYGVWSGTSGKGWVHGYYHSFDKLILVIGQENFEEEYIIHDPDFKLASPILFADTEQIMMTVTQDDVNNQNHRLVMNSEDPKVDTYIESLRINPDWTTKHESNKTDIITACAA
jgi:hypothetical protein